jgi:SPP1 family predicted phage head-tail adaptor
MLAGRLRKRVTVQRRSTTLDSLGGQATTWTDVCTLWAEITPTGGKELQTGGAIRAESMFTITTRYYAGIVPKMRILFEGQPYNILNVNDTESRHRELVISCSAGLSDG